MYRPAEIRDFEVSPQVDEQVFWLNVSVNDFLGVAVVKGVGQLCYVLRGVWPVGVVTGRGQLTHRGRSLLWKLCGFLQFLE